MNVTFTYGTGNTATKTFAAGTTLGQALQNETLRAFLGYGANVEGYIGGVPQPNTTVLAAGMQVSIHDKACAKAS